MGDDPFPVEFNFSVWFFAGIEKAPKQKNYYCSGEE
jgi:hypothetical protein